MLAEQNEVIDECVYTMAQLSEDDKIRMQCVARKDYIAREKGIYSRGKAEGLAEGEIIGLVKAYYDAEWDIAKIAKKCNISEEKVREILHL